MSIVNLNRDHSEKLKKENLDVTFIRLDVTDIEMIRAAKDSIEKTDGKLDVLVNNAGKSPDSSYLVGVGRSNLCA